MTDDEARAAAALRRLALDEGIKDYVLRHEELYAPLLRAARRFIGGETLAEAVAAARLLNGKGHAVTIDYMGESTRDASDAAEATEEFLGVVRAMVANSLDASVSLDLSHVGLVVDEHLCLENVSRLLEAASQSKIEVMISAEGVDRTDAVLRVYQQLSQRFENVGITLQAYLYRTPEDLAAVVRRPGKIRLVKGAFDAPPALAMPRGDALDDAYLKFLEMLVGLQHPISIATHDERLLEQAGALLRGPERSGSPVEFEMLQGIAPHLLQSMREQGLRTRVYLPYGREWHLYLCNRLAERPPNLFRALSDAFGIETEGDGTA